MWFDWCFENPEKINPNHAAMYFFAIEHCNRLGWKEKFGLPMEMTKDAIGIKNYRTFYKTFNDLVEWGFFKVIQKSKNQYSSNVIAIVKNTKATSKALDTALQKQHQKQVCGTVGIDKPLTINKEPINNKIYSFDDFWKLYPVKVAKIKCKKKYEALLREDKVSIFETLEKFISHKPFLSYNHPNPETYINQRRWEDEIHTKVNNLTPAGTVEEWIAQNRKNEKIAL